MHPITQLLDRFSVILLISHEKTEGKGQDRRLSKEGVQRAEALHRKLAVQGIFNNKVLTLSSPRTRCLQTTGIVVGDMPHIIQDLTGTPTMHDEFCRVGRQGIPNYNADVVATFLDSCWAQVLETTQDDSGILVISGHDVYTGFMADQATTVLGLEPTPEVAALQEGTCGNGACFVIKTNSVTRVA